MIEIAAILAALSGPIAKLIEVVLSDIYDAEAERQAMLDLQAAIYQERLKKALTAPR